MRKYLREVLSQDSMLDKKNNWKKKDGNSSVNGPNGTALVSTLSTNGQYLNRDCWEEDGTPHRFAVV